MISRPQYHCGNDYVDDDDEDRPTPTTRTRTGATSTPTIATLPDTPGVNISFFSSGILFIYKINFEHQGCSRSSYIYQY